ncbi:hypothetical protein QG37_02959 [Candidozyma auris]|uniref:Uncharacterized protein n=1 Tax=Candidozyma auris TaxID=498019 RepID=A0A0L0P181_CANAR|nr:hypothetical protein QG37_02959 [[Candida] auris]
MKLEKGSKQFKRQLERQNQLIRVLNEYSMGLYQSLQRQKHNRISKLPRLFTIIKWWIG